MSAAAVVERPSAERSVERGTAPFRVLRLVSPAMTGPDVQALQCALNKRARPRDLATIDVDGEYGPATAGLYRIVGYQLGLLDTTLDRGATIEAQRIVIDPGRRSKAQLARAKRRTHEGPGAAIRWALAQVGTKEQPANSNRGPRIDKWQAKFGIEGSAWCGAYAGYALKVHGGVPISDRVVYCPSIEADAKLGVGGWEKFIPADRASEAKCGDAVLFDFSVPATEPEHVGLLVEPVRGGQLHTVEGNTSGGPGGSQSNGGMVAARRDRGIGSVVGFARPRWGD